MAHTNNILNAMFFEAYSIFFLVRFGVGLGLGSTSAFKVRVSVTVRPRGDRG